MPRYKIEISRTAEKQLKQLPREAQKRVVSIVLTLAHDPFPKGSRKLWGYPDVFRVRAGRYRILYSVSKQKLIIIVLKIGHRKDIYR